MVYAPAGSVVRNTTALGHRAQGLQCDLYCLVLAINPRRIINDVEEANESRLWVDFIQI